LAGTFYNNLGNYVEDYFTIEKQVKPKNAGYTAVQYPLN